MRSRVFQRILATTPKEVEIFVDWYADLVVRINQLLQEQNISRKALAERLDKSPSEISKWMSGEHNFTLRSLAKLSAELGAPLLEVPKKKTKPTFLEDGFVCRMHMNVNYPKREAKNTDRKWQSAESAEADNLLSNVG